MTYFLRMLPISLMGLLSLMMPTGRLGAAEQNGDALEEAQQAGANLALVALPPQVEQALDQAIAFMQAPTSAVTLGALRPLLAFIRQEAATGRAWQPRDRWDADGAATLVTLPSALSNHIALYYSATIPDYAIFPSSMRYSSVLDTAAFTRATLACVPRAIPLNQYAYGRFRCIEETTPNPQSGTAYHYTNVRAIARLNLAGREIFMSFSDMLGRSSYAVRGVAVGPVDDHLYYYSEKPGTNLRGLSWVQPIMYISRSLIVNVALDKRHTASCAFSWVNAGWRGLNVTRTYHIIPILQTIQQKMLSLARAPNASAAQFSTLTDAVMGLPTAHVAARYQAYCDYVTAWRDKGNKKGLTSLLKRSILSELYDAQTMARLDDGHRRALILQEDVRQLLGQPTWSAGQK